MNDLDDGPETGKEMVKRKSRNLSEKKRRDQFNMLINELFSMVATSNRKMDKTTILKMTIAFLKQHNELTQQSHVHEIPEDWKPSFLSNVEFAQLMLESQESFVMVLSRSGSILYSSEGVMSLLNQIPSDLQNDSVFNYIHPEEQIKVKSLLLSHQSSFPPETNQAENPLSFICHFKCGSLVANDPPLYERVELKGYFRKWNQSKLFLGVNDEDDANIMIGGLPASKSEELCFFCTVKLQSIQVIRELSYVDEAKKEFTSRHSMEWKFLFLDHRGPPIVGYQPFEVLGTSGYDYYHPDDLDKMGECHEQLMQSGEGTSCYYRFLTKGQQWLWLQTHYYITYHQWSSKPEFIVCTNTVVNFAEVRSALRQQSEEKETEQKDDPKKVKTSWPAETVSSPTSKMAEQPQTPTAAESQPPQSSSDPAEVEMMFTDNQTPQQPPSLAETRPQLMKALKEDPVKVMSQPAAAAAAAATASTAAAPSTAGSFVVTLNQPMFVPGAATPQTSFMQPLYLSPAQQRLQEQLKLKHQQLQESILRQQQELHHIWEQLMLTSRLNVPTVITPTVAQNPSMSSPMVVQAPSNEQGATREPLLMPIPFFSQTATPQPQQMQQQLQQQQMQQIQQQQQLQQQQMQPQQFILPTVQSPIAVVSPVSPVPPSNSQPVVQGQQTQIVVHHPMHSPQISQPSSSTLQSSPNAQQRQQKQQQLPPSQNS